jgi:hypothetical protein
VVSQIDDLAGVISALNDVLIELGINHGSLINEDDFVGMDLPLGSPRDLGLTCFVVIKDLQIHEAVDGLGLKTG